MIYKETDNECVGCERCVNCGRNENKEYTFVQCDFCGDEDYLENKTMYDYKGKHVCKKCGVKIALQELADKGELVERLIELVDDDILFDMVCDELGEVEDE